MKVVEFYILRRAFAIFAATLLWVLAIVWTTQILTRIDVVTGSGQSAATFFEIAVLVLPAVLPVVLPFAVGIAVAQTLSTMNSDSELIVLSAAGGPRMTVMRPMLILALGACIASFMIHNFVEPYSRERLRVVVSESRADLITTVIREGAFHEIDKGLHMQIGERLPDGRLGGIFVSDTREETTELIYYAKSGTTVEVDGQHLLVMQDGVVHRKNADGVSVVRYKSYALDLSQFMSGSSTPTLYAKDRSLFYLLNPDPNDKIFKERPQSFRAELHQRLSDWMYPLVFALIGLAVAADSRSFREARMHPLLTTMTIVLLVRWLGFYADNKLTKVPEYAPMVYAIPIGAIAIAVYFLATNRIMEVPSAISDRISDAWDKGWEKVVSLKDTILGNKRSTKGGAA